MKRNTVIMTVCMLLSGFPRLISGFPRLVLGAARKVPLAGSRTLGVHACTPQDQLSLAENAFSVLARNGRSWQRLKDVVELALRSDRQQVKSVADIGTDHGLLAAALALSGRFERVLGVDASERALQDGALTLKEEILEYHHQKQQIPLPIPLSLEFRHGDGLKVVQPGEAGVVCIAGMGVHTMLEIVSATNAGMDVALVDSLGCKQLVLQPTNSRPRNMIMLYDNLRDLGWQVEDERIGFLSSRWYFSTSFVRSDPNSAHVNDGLLPGMKIAEFEQPDSVFQAYVEHHCAWLRKERQAAGQLRDGEDRWLATFDTNYRDS
jgi:tRNA A22 N-methylase